MCTHKAATLPTKRSQGANSTTVNWAAKVQSRQLHLQEQGEADKARLKQQHEEELEANRRQRDKVQAEKAKVEAALERLELENRQRAEGIRQAEAAAAQARAAELAAEDAKKRDIILQLRCSCPPFESCKLVHIADISSSSQSCNLHKPMLMLFPSPLSALSAMSWLSSDPQRQSSLLPADAPRTALFGSSASRMLDVEARQLLLSSCSQLASLCQLCQLTEVFVLACGLVHGQVHGQVYSGAGPWRRCPGGTRSLTRLRAEGTTCWRRCPCWSCANALLPPSSAIRLFLPMSPDPEHSPMPSTPYHPVFALLLTSSFI